MANYTIIAKNGDVVVKEVKESLSNYFIQKQAAAYRIANKAVELYDASLLWRNKTWNNTDKLKDLGTYYYRGRA